MLNPGESPEEATAPDRVWARVGPYLDQDDAELIRAVNYMFRSRIADTWRHGRVLLAGDAAHEMPPFLGQGMCSGIRDSHNLAWKLDLVLTGQADPALLDTYQPEREPHVRFITEKAIELGRVQTIRDPVAALERDQRLLELRAADRKPEKLKLPGLSGRMVAGSGAFFLQSQVRAGGRTGRFDDIVGAGWCIVASSPDVLNQLSAAQRESWAAIGGQIEAFGTDQQPLSLVDIQGDYGAWFDANSCRAAVVRPDWYLYGTARDAAALAVLVDRLWLELRRESALDTLGTALRVNAKQHHPTGRD